MTMGVQIPWGEFTAWVRGMLGDEDAGGLEPSTRLDLIGFDSLAMAEFLELAESHGHRLDPDLVVSLATLGDLHHYLTAPGTAIVGTESQFELRTITDGDHPALFRLHTDGDSLATYRFRGSTPSPEAFRAAIWENVLRQYMVVHQNRLAGLVTAFDANHRHGHAHLAVIAGPDYLGTGLVPQATFRFLRELFEDFPLRKIYAEVLAPNLGRFRSGLGRNFVIEGTLRQHEYFATSYVDLHLLATYRERWLATPA